MSQEGLKIKVCEEALEVFNQRRHVMLPQIRDSIENQLNWLVSFFKGEVQEREQLFKLTLGRFTVHEIDPREKELINAIRKANYVAVRTREGLKLEMDVLSNDT